MKEYIKDIVRLHSNLQDSKEHLFDVWLEGIKRDFLANNNGYTCVNDYLDDEASINEICSVLDKTTMCVDDFFESGKYIAFVTQSNKEKEELAMSNTEKAISNIFKGKNISKEEMSRLIEYIEEQKEI